MPDWDNTESRESDEDATWRDLVARFETPTTTAGPVPWPDRENVPRPRAEACYAMVERSRALVVLGSSLTVMSGFRYVRHAAGLQRPVVIVNQGETRGDGYATATLDAPLGRTLTDLVAALRSPR